MKSQFYLFDFFLNLCKCIVHSSHVWWLCRAWCWHNFLCSCLLFKLIALGLYLTLFRVHHFSSVAQSCLNLCDPMNCRMSGLPVHHQLLDSTQTHVHQVGDAIQPVHPLSSPSPSALNLSQHQGLYKWVALRIRWPKYWSFSFNISLSNEHPGLISFRMDGWISVQSKGLSRVFSNTTVQKHQFFGTQLSL